MSAEVFVQTVLWTACGMVGAHMTGGGGSRKHEYVCIDCLRWKSAYDLFLDLLTKEDR